MCIQSNVHQMVPPQRISKDDQTQHIRTGTRGVHGGGAVMIWASSAGTVPGHIAVIDACI